MVSTTNFRFPLPDFDKRLWHEDFYQTIRTVDAVLAQYIAVNNIVGVWDNGVAYTVGERVIDGDVGLVYECLVSHTSPTSPTTFADSRTSNPSYWQAFGAVDRIKGEWAVSTSYVVGDYVYYGHIYARCSTTHTSSTVFANDSVNWAYLIDATTTVANADASEAAALAAQVAAELAETNAETAAANAAASEATVAADAATASAAAVSATNDAAQVAADKITVAADKATVAADKATVAADKAAAAASAAAALVSETNAGVSEVNAAASAATASAAAAGIVWKAPAVAATTANVTLSGEQTIDGIALVAGDRVLVKDQSSVPENGIYIVASGAWTRATDADTWAEIVSMVVTASRGTTNADTSWIVTSDLGGIIGTNNIVFSIWRAVVAASETQSGIVELATQAEVDTGTDAVRAVTPATLTGKSFGLSSLASAAKAYDIGFVAGFDSTYTAENLVVQTYGKVTIPRAITIEGEDADLSTAATGAALIIDVEKNGSTVYSTKPQFAASSTTLTAGTLSTTSVSAGDQLTFKVTQIGSTVAGAGLTFTIKGRLA